MLAQREKAKEVKLWNGARFQTVELLVTTTHRREAAYGRRSSGRFWWPQRSL